MGEVISFVIIVAIWGYCAITQTRDRKREEEFCKQKMTEYAIKGDEVMENLYFERLMRIK